MNDVENVFIPLVAGRQPVLADFLVGGLFETLTGVSAATTSPVTTTARSFNVKSYAAYAQASYALTDMFTLTAGARYTRRSEEHTSELQSLMRISYAVFCLKKKTSNKKNRTLLKNTM